MSTLELQELVANLAKSQAETDRQMRESRTETDRQLKETDRQLKETDRQLKAMAKSLERSDKETDRHLKETQDEIKELGQLFRGQWGLLVEALMRPGTVKLFQERGLPLKQSTGRRKGLDKANREIEFDMTLVNGGLVVPVEIKTRMNTSEVKWAINKLKRFTEAFDEYAGWEVQGAVAALSYESESDKYAYRQGLWVLRCDDGIASLVNDEKFKPAKW
ncbi:MAG: hypothetical protein ACK5LK_10105 [Chthoniobacterales bacterium]